MLLEFDLGGSDWFVTAFYANEPNMKAVFRSGKSPHPATGSRITGLSPELIVQEDKLLKETSDPLEIARIRREKLPEVLKARFLPRTMSIRQMSKKSNHGLNFRESFRTFALVNEIDEREAKTIIQLYREVAYPGLPKWYERIDKTIKDTRTLTNCLGRKCYFSGALNDDTFRQATSFVPQSTTFDVTALAMPKMLDDESLDFRPAQLLAQVHDSLLTQYVSNDFNAMARFVIKLGLDYMSPELSYGEPFTLSVGLKVGLTWGSLKEIELTADENKQTEILEHVWDEAKQKQAA